VPENGAANAALERLVAKTLGVPASSVSVVAGGTARLKTLRVLGKPVALARRIEALTANPRLDVSGVPGSDFNLPAANGDRRP
jgi:class 3 adenylate cyclase